jgi:hypothetical protein
MRFFLLATLLSMPAPAFAAFHEWDVVEVFTDESETVQFIELATNAAGQQFLADHFIRTEDDNVALQTYTFEFDLDVEPPDTTAGRRFLIGTPGFFEFSGVVPDYEMPSGFIEVGVADEINFAHFDSFALAGLPTDGVNSLLDDGSTLANSPTNFAGVTGSVVVPEPAGAFAALSAFAALAVASRRR